MPKKMRGSDNNPFGFILFTFHGYHITNVFCLEARPNSGLFSFGPDGLLVVVHDLFGDKGI